ncbi:helix-turn-helix domain-containing protein [Niameybacter massiliensis]|uniref:helix-turn-helix domain-containing protein n=1 Tax=Niameybacter massiliensis TaxID=1658108 RepID=UPI0006B4E5C9|nr:helix-turn-helix transcriptional regulator [Niameybacter massiliensis]
MEINIKKIVVARIRAGLSLVELAEKTGINRITLSKIEKGYQKPKIQTINKLASVLNIKLEDIIQ